MARPMLPETETIDGSETIIVRKGTSPYRALLSRIVASLVKAPRIERYTATTNAQGQATITFAPAFTKPPLAQIVTGWDGTSGDRYIGGGVTSVTATGCTAQSMVSRGSLLLSAGPFQKAPSGVTVTVQVIGT